MEDLVGCLMEVMPLNSGLVACSLVAVPLILELMVLENMGTVLVALMDHPLLVNNLGNMVVYKMEDSNMLWAAMQTHQANMVMAECLMKFKQLDRAPKPNLLQTMAHPISPNLRGSDKVERQMENTVAAKYLMHHKSLVLEVMQSLLGNMEVRMHTSHSHLSLHLQPQLMQPVTSLTSPCLTSPCLLNPPVENPM